MYVFIYVHGSDPLVKKDQNITYTEMAHFGLICPIPIVSCPLFVVYHITPSPAQQITTKSANDLEVGVQHRGLFP
jgi:hypothetical protein